MRKTILSGMAGAALVLGFQCAEAQQGTVTTKERYIPEKVYRIPDGNNYDDPNSEYSFKRMVESDNFAAFWSKEFGDDPMTNPDASKRFDLKAAVAEGERFYNFYIDTLKFVDRGKSWTDKYKILFYVISGEGGTAFGGGAEDKIGIFWTPPGRINRAPYGALAHELGHSFQYLVRANGGNGASGSMGEMTSQYMLWQVYPEWMTFENYHLKSFMEQTHYAFLHPTNMYHSPYVLEYWSNIHGKDFVGRLWRESEKGEDAVTTYKRLTAMAQPAFNDELFDACRRFITWDMPRIRQVASPYADQHFTTLVDAGAGWYRIDSTKCPQNYGYNGIKLDVPTGKRKISLEFEGLAGSKGYTAYNADKAGWRYGFVAHKTDGTRVYGKVGNSPKGKLAFEVPDGTAYLWLVVMGAPTEHWPIPMRRRRGAEGSQAEAPKEEQWPYQIKLTGTTINKDMIKP